MLDRIAGVVSRNLAFIAWGNFTDPVILGRWLETLALVALVAAVAAVLGSLLVDERRLDDATDALVVLVGSGIALGAVALSVLALVHLYRPLPIALLAAAATALALWRRPARTLGTLRRLTTAVREQPLLWAGMAVCSLPALLPPYRWDETGYHLAYAQQWVHAGGITLDPTMQYPLYTFNWQVVQGVGLMLGGTPLVHVMSWLATVLATLVVMRFAARLGAPRRLALLAGVAYFVTPLVQRYSVIGMVDAPLMAYLALSAYVLWLAATTRPISLGLVLAAGACAGMFVGMKIVGAVYAPLFVVLAALHWRDRRLAAYAAALAVAGGIWYARNLLLTGDPLTPLLAHAVHRPAPYWSEWDLAAQAADLRRGLQWTPRALLLLPVRMLTATDKGPLRDWPALGYVLLFPLSLLLVRRLWRERAIALLAIAWFAAAVWVATSYLIRYAEFLPLAAVLAAVLIASAWAWLRERGARVPALAAGAAAVVLLVGPLPASVSYLKTQFAVPIPAHHSWSEIARVDHDARVVAALEDLAPAGADVYTTQPHLRFWFQRAGYHVLSGTFHPGRVADLARAAQEGRAAEYLRSLGARWVTVDSGHAYLTPDERARLAASPGLTLRYRSPAFTIYEVRDDVLADH